MSKKRKDGCRPPVEMEREEMMNLTKVAKSWEFTCSFCFKKFPSAQAMGGHQNAHRSERLEEKRLFVRDPIGYRKRAFLRAMKSGNANGGALGIVESTHAEPEDEPEDGAKGKACTSTSTTHDSNIDADHNLDLTLKL